MPITIGPGVNPSLLGQAGLAEGQGDLARWTAEMNLKAQALNAHNQQNQPAPAPMTDHKVFEHGEWINPDAPAAQQNPFALQDAIYDHASQQRISDLQSKHQQIESSDYLTPEQKEYAHQSLDQEFTLGAKYKPLQQQQSMEDYMKQNSTTLPDGSTVIRDHTGHITHIAPKQQPAQVEGGGGDVGAYEGLLPDGQQIVDSHPNADGTKTLMGQDGKFYDENMQPVSPEQARQKAGWVKSPDGTILDAKGKIVLDPHKAAHEKFQEEQRTAQEQHRTAQAEAKTAQGQHKTESEIGKQYDDAVHALAKRHSGDEEAWDPLEHQDEIDSYINAREAHIQRKTGRSAAPVAPQADPAKAQADVDTLIQNNPQTRAQVSEYITQAKAQGLDRDTIKAHVLQMLRGQ